ncbi:MAG: hypothetical protein K8T20_05530, partial [Planctomycetes bacterium]|nr:hypothetical protein [Planctomycetota bacterium]
MTISFSCSCGYPIRVPDSKAGALGKCPACAASVRVPSPAVAVASCDRSASEPSPLEMAEDPGPPPAKAHPPCPHCGTQYHSDVVICVACGLNLLTGQPVGARLSTEPFRARHPVANDEPDTDSIGFWKMTAGVLLHPLQTLEYFGALFARPEMLAKATVFYAASFVAVAVA